ncbi:MAG: hypothetical protein E7069_00730 [Bacteroidales bacterium]|jgi:endonuclease I|nr:hypothetical protein [Bacteroidales bacterium]
MKKLNSIFILLWVTLVALAEPFDREAYYGSANGKCGEELRKVLTQILSSNGKVLSYDELWSAYATTDVREDGTIWDIYSNVTAYDPSKNHGGNYKKEGDCYNREHSIPQSVFNKQQPMRTDLYHVIPTDGYVNNQRGSYCFGEVASVKYASKNSFSKTGTPTSELKNAGCKESIVFEPNDEYKGDIARTYFYFVIRYASNMSSFKKYGMFSNNTLSSWASEMLIKWSTADVVSAKETNRVEAVYELQKNRNPFIDYPGLEEYIWGSYKNVPFSASNYVNPYTGQSGNDTPEPTPDPTPDPTPTPEPIVTSGDVYIKVTEEPNDWSGAYLVVYESSLVAFNSSLEDIDAKKNSIKVTLENGGIAVDDETEKAEIIITKNSNSTYSIKTSNGVYIGGEKGKNGIATSESAIENNIMLSNGQMIDIVSNDMHLKFNPQNKQERFRYFKASSGGMKMVTLYRKTVSSNGGSEVDEPNTPEDPGTVTDVTPVRSNATQTDVIFDLNGRRLKSITYPGIYIINGQKVVKQ